MAAPRQLNYQKKARTSSLRVSAGRGDRASFSTVLPGEECRAQNVVRILNFLMQTEFRAIVQSEYGAPERVLKIAKCQLNSEKLGADEVLIKVIARPIHVGDVHILSALPQGGLVAPIPQGTYRLPGFEGVG